jgi:RNA polymerase sigma factor for flagellar operon FliA
MSAASAPATYTPAASAEAVEPYIGAPDRDDLIVRHAPLVRHVVGRLAMALPRTIETDDLIGYGTIGLIEAVDRYDPTRGVAFEAFAVERIRGSIIDAVRAADPVPRYTRRRVKEIQQTFLALEATLGRAPRDEEVAERLGLTMAQYHRAIADSSRTVDSIYRVVRSGAEEGNVELLDYLCDPDTPSPEEVSDTRELHQSVVRALGRLDERERQILSLYYERGLTLREISAVLDLSESRVWQLHARAITRIRGYVHADGEAYGGAQACA